MASKTEQRLLSPEEIAVRAGQQVPFLRLPVRATVYAERAMRLRQRAVGHPMRDYLLFIAELCEAQHAVLQSSPDVVLPDPAALDRAARLGAPPLPATLWPRDPLWRDGLRRLLTRLAERLDPTAARAQVATVLAADDAWLEDQAERLLGTTTLGLDLASAPLVAAGLQLHWTHLVLATEAAAASTARPSAAFGRVDDATRCPCCASRPTASVARIGGDAGGYRYLHCSLCATEWHLVRIKCSRCLGTAGIHYQSLQQASDDASGEHGARQPVVEAETCDSCGHYLKIAHMGRDPEVEPVADDLASVTLDLLVSEAGFERHGVNLLLLFGDAENDRDGDERDAGHGSGGPESGGSDVATSAGASTGTSASTRNGRCAADGNHEAAPSQEPPR